MKRELTERQQEVYDFLLSFWHENGFPPAIREVAAHFGFRSTRAVVDHLNALERKGWIIRGRERSRAIEFPREPLPGAVDVVELPLVGRIAAGEPILAVENVVDQVAVDRSWVRGETPFLLQVVGDSMRDAGILEGDLVLVSRQSTADDQDVVVALIEDEATVKRLRKRGQSIVLEPANPAYQPIEVRHGPDFRLVGKVVGLYRKM
ncbi:MAG: transcriptional repressor LexA [Candidatus Eiseniibacteriota bacterium]|jgi:repressor LexA